MNREQIAELREVVRARAELGLPGPDPLPVDTYREAVPFLRRPFTPEAVKWKVQNLLGVQKGSNGKPDPTTAKGGQIVPYIDARLVIERLNLVIPEWVDHYEPFAQGALRCELTVADVGPRPDVGFGNDAKAQHSDALKRAAVKFGVGVSLYALAAVRMWRAGEDDEAGDKLRPNYRKHLELDDHNRVWLRDKYALWLERVGIEKFGEPLDHGDVFDAVGDPHDPDAEAETEGVAAADPVLTDDRANELVTTARLQFKRLRLLDRKALLPGEFEARLTEAQTSHEALERLVEEIASQADGLAEEAKS